MLGVGQDLVQVVVDGRGGGVFQTHHPLLFHPHFGRTGEPGEHIFALCSVNDSEDNGGLSIVVCSARLEHEIKVDLGWAFFVCAHISAV